METVSELRWVCSRSGNCFWRGVSCELSGGTQRSILEVLGIFGTSWFTSITFYMLVPPLKENVKPTVPNRSKYKTNRSQPAQNRKPTVSPLKIENQPFPTPQNRKPTVPIAQNWKQIVPNRSKQKPTDQNSKPTIPNRSKATTKIQNSNPTARKWKLQSMQKRCGQKQDRCGLEQIAPLSSTTIK